MIGKRGLRRKKKELGVADRKKSDGKYMKSHKNPEFSAQHGQPSKSIISTYIHLFCMNIFSWNIAGKICTKFMPC
jgi:hypothetical protein